MDTNTLLYKISSVDYLTKSWLKLNKANENSHGLSDESIKPFEKDREDKIQSISKRLREGKYRFSSYRPVLIPKRDGTERPLQIPDIQDRLVFKALALELEEIFKDTLTLSCSFHNFLHFKFDGKIIQTCAISSYAKYCKSANKNLIRWQKRCSGKCHRIATCEMLKNAIFCYAGENKNPHKWLIYRDFLKFASYSSGERGNVAFL